MQDAPGSSQLLSTSHLLTFSSVEQFRTDLTRLLILALFHRAHPHLIPHVSSISRRPRHPRQLFPAIPKSLHRTSHHFSISHLRTLQAFCTILDSEDTGVVGAARRAGEKVTRGKGRGLPHIAIGAAPKPEEVSVGRRSHSVAVGSEARREGVSQRGDVVALASWQARKDPVSRLRQAVTSSKLHFPTPRISHVPFKPL